MDQVQILGPLEYGCGHTGAEEEVLPSRREGMCRTCQREADAARRRELGLPPDRELVRPSDEQGRLL